MRHKVISVSSFILACAISLALPDISAARADELRAHCPPAGDSDFFFPVNAFDGARPDLDAFEREWYSQHLAAMREPSLSCEAAGASETYRFLWLISFHRSISVRLVLKGDRGRIEFTELTGSGGYEPGHVRRHTERRLSRDEASRFAKALNDADFWQLSTSIRDHGLDGAQWIVEGRRGGTYHVVDRFFTAGRDIPSARTAFSEAGSFFCFTIGNLLSQSLLSWIEPSEIRDGVFIEAVVQQMARDAGPHICVPSVVS